ncbi:hypothetical protein [Secundilactobacillus silagei]|uniref:Uncharacterized protein n=1 Tax=Secundilactobacillus silagei JCM 19001 TaxID=1302250 RepID=A0A1Z5H3T5_9LACO|nr:hypothetical protein [Secundilactobacillus silagei]TDG70262.1 hypothetical protein C5L25_001452 [Secundilactobacillus silagei JCM 19001]GAT17966.1 hypothetical protein IWT126_00223 [Secundilactobacillus silagei JCM 19001]
MINDNQFQISLNEKLLISIQSYQKKLQLTNHAILNIISYEPTRENQFFAGEASHTSYVKAAYVLDSIFQFLKQHPFKSVDYLQQLRALPPHNIFLRNRYAFWLSNFINAGGTKNDLIQDAKLNGTDILEQIVWSGNYLITTKSVAHLKTHTKQIVDLSANEYHIVRDIMKKFSTASRLFYVNFDQLYQTRTILKSAELQPYWNQVIEFKKTMM